MSLLFRNTMLTICLLFSAGYFWQGWLAKAQGPDPTRRVNAPYFSDDIVPSEQAAIFWFGQVDPTNNHANVRVGYNDDRVEVSVHIFDRRVWSDDTPNPSDLADWDAITLYLNLDGKIGSNPTAQSYQFVAQINPSWGDRSNYQTAFKGNNSNWVAAPVSFTTTAFYRGMPNDNGDDRGWQVSFLIPFSSLGLSSPPPSGTVWGLAVALHDRDDAAGTPISAQTWPEAVDTQQPSTWGELTFGLPTYTPPISTLGGVVTVRHGLNGVSVPDAHVGGHSICGAPFDPNYFNGWGEANYAGYSQINIQNQWDVADWPCFSKYYVTFPLDTLPTDKSIISATLTMYLFGNAWGPPPSSLIQVLTVAENWDEATITWNNAPLAVENVAATWVDPVSSDPGWPGIPITWDVSRAVAEAYESGKPLRLALYSADGEYHSGKYFSSSDTGDWNAEGRPTLEVFWGDSSFALNATSPTQMIDAGGVATYTIAVQHSDNFTHTVTLQAGTSPSPDLTVSLFPPTTFPHPGGQTTLTLTDLHPASFSSGIWYTIPLTATGGGITQTINVNLLVNGQEVFLPIIVNDS